MRVRHLFAVAALAAALLIAFGPATPASAAPATAEVVCATWKAEGATGAYPAVVFGGKPEGTVISKSSVKLVKPAGEGLVQPGVQFTSRTIGVTTEAATTVKVAYSLSGGASPAAGAVRLFGYSSADADVLLDAPTWADSATGTEGTLTLNVAAGTKIGLLGLVYDASNDAQGAVTFSGLKIGDRLVRFTPCPKPPSASPSTSPSAKPSASAGPSTSAKPSTSPAAPVAPAPPAAGPTLPVTGPSVGALLGVALGALILGGVAFVATRRRSPRTFEA